MIFYMSEHILKVKHQSLILSWFNHALENIKFILSKHQNINFLIIYQNAEKKNVIRVLVGGVQEVLDDPHEIDNSRGCELVLKHVIQERLDDYRKQVRKYQELVEFGPYYNYQFIVDFADSVPRIFDLARFFVFPSSIKRVIYFLQITNCDNSTQVRFACEFMWIKYTQ